MQKYVDTCNHVLLKFNREGNQRPCAQLSLQNLMQEVPSGLACNLKALSTLLL